MAKIHATVHVSGKDLGPFAGGNRAVYSAKELAQLKADAKAAGANVHVKSK
jgi:hypothetical protein